MTKTLEDVARGINWYSTPERLLADVDRFLCQVMARGVADEIITTQRRFTREQFRNAYLAAPPGLFTKRAWAYWGLVLFDNPKLAMPERFPGANQFDWRRAT
jgi:hypothetical protein